MRGMRMSLSVQRAADDVPHERRAPYADSTAPRLRSVVGGGVRVQAHADDRKLTPREVGVFWAGKRPLPENAMSQIACCFWWLVLGFVLGWLANWLLSKMFRRNPPAATRVDEEAAERAAAAHH